MPVQEVRLTRAVTEVRGMSDAAASLASADTISSLNRTTVLVIGNESLRTQLSELSRPPHQPKWPRVGA